MGRASALFDLPNTGLGLLHPSFAPGWYWAGLPPLSLYVSGMANIGLRKMYRATRDVLDYARYIGRGALRQLLGLVKFGIAMPALNAFEELCFGPGEVVRG